MRLLWNGTSGVMVLLICGIVSGCRHQPIAPTVSAKVQPPTILVPPSPAENSRPMQTPNLPPVVTDAKMPIVVEAKPKKRPRKQLPTPVTTQVAPATTPDPVVAPVETAKLGDLAPGGDTNPQQQQEVAGKISAVEKRVSDLPAAVADHEQKQIAQVKLFLKEAADALKGGDVEGAKILAMKADLLVDDVQEVSR